MFVDVDRRGRRLRRRQRRRSRRTGSSEAVEVVFDPEKIGLVDILRWFWEAHDPTCGMGQGNDRGTQYSRGRNEHTEGTRK